MYIFAEPVTEEQVQELQSRNDAKIEEFERDILGLNRDSVGSGDVEKEDNKWAEIQAKVQEAMDKDERSIGEMDEGVEFESGITTVDRNANDEAVKPQSEEYDEEPPVEGDYSLNATASGNINSEDDEGEDEDNVDDEQEQDGEQEEEEEEEGNDEDVEEDDEGEEEEGDEEIGEEQEGDGVEEKDESSEGDLKGVNLQPTLDDPAESTLQPNPDALKGIIEDLISSAQDPFDEIKSSSITTPEAVEDITTMDSDRPEAQTPDALSTDKEQTPSVEASTTPSTAPSKESETHADSQFLDQIDRERASIPTPENPPDILAMSLTIRNKVNDRYILRPDNLTPEDSWSIEYSLVEVTKESTAWSLYHACQLRRKRRLDGGEEQGEENAAVNYYVQKLRNMSQRGRGWRREQDRKDEGNGKVVLGREEKDTSEGGSGGSRGDGSAS